MRWLIMSHLIWIYPVAIQFLNFDWEPYLEEWFCPKSNMGESTSETLEWKGVVLCYRQKGNILHAYAKSDVRIIYTPKKSNLGS